MSTVASDEYETIGRAAIMLGVGEWKIRYWIRRDPKFPRGLRAGRTVVKPSAVAEYFRRLDTVEEVSGPLGEHDAADEKNEGEE